MNTQSQAWQSPRMSVDEYLAWAMEQPTGRYELVDGEVVAMAPERVRHTLVKGEAAFALRQAIRARGLDCQTFVDGASVRIDDATVYEPDALVRGGPPLPGDDLLVPDPLIVVEVLSPSTAHVDTGKKLVGYLSLPSVRHYLVLDPEKRTIIHHRREGDPGTRVETTMLGAFLAKDEASRSRELVLDPPGLTIRCADLFDAP